jgi:CBS domain containing-hemolysin-like protein
MIAGLIAIVLLAALVTLVSYVERIYTEMGKFLTRKFEENIEVFTEKIEPRLGVSRARAALSMALLEQLLMAAIVLVVAYLVFSDAAWTVAELVQAAIAIILAIVIFNRIIPYVLFSRTKGEWLVSSVPLLRMLIYLALPVTLLIGFVQSVVALAEEPPGEEPEKPSEAVDALIEAGREEGILEETDRELIHSVVEFGEKTVREVMTPRPEVVAVSTETTLEQFIELLRTKPYSRVPVYEGSIDHIAGIVFAHDALQVLDSDARTQTVRRMMKPVRFVPETQRVSGLLRELQRENIHMAIVVDEYGNTAGVVTIEDLVEEIVGEIRDEHEAKADIVREGERRYVVPGNMDMDRMDELFGVAPETREATTVGGFVSERLGRIPRTGEVFEQDGLRFEVLEATDRRVERLRITPAQARELRTK